MGRTVRARSLGLVTFVGLGALVPGALVAAVLAACGDDEATSSRVVPSPGATLGADVAVAIVGAGSVVSDPPGVDCPTGSRDPGLPSLSGGGQGVRGGCTVTFIVDPDVDASGRTSAALTARPAPGWRFAGWSFATVDVPGRSAGPGECQPVVRAAQAPAVDTRAPTVSLAFGEAPGRAPAGREGDCASALVVPFAYRPTATFVPDDAIADGGLDAGDAGEGGTLEPGTEVFAAPQQGAVGGAVFVRSSRVYWTWTVGGQGAVSFGISSGGARTDLSPLGNPVTALDVDALAVWQTAAGLFVAGIGSSQATALPSAPACAALASDFGNAFCRTPSEVLSWSSGGAGPVTQHVGLPAGGDVGVDGVRLYFTDPASQQIAFVPQAGDGGAPTPTVVAAGQLAPTALGLGTSYVAWKTGDGQLRSASKTGGGAVTTFAVAGTLTHVTTDGSSYVYYAVDTGAPNGATFYRALLTGGAPTLVATGVTSPRGLASDGSYVYWTTPTGAVRRILR